MDILRPNPSDDNTPNKRRSTAPVLPFEEARTFVRSLNLKGYDDWCTYRKSGLRPLSIPTHPDRAYPGEFQNYGDWLGTYRIANQLRQFLPFEDAREYVRSLALKNRDEWCNYYKSGLKPEAIPCNPRRAYKEKWQGWGDWLGTGRIADRYMVYLSFEDARDFVRSLGLKGHAEWRAYCKSDRKPSNIPANPYQTYKEQFTSFGDWLGTGFIALFKREYLSFEEATACVHMLGIKSQTDWVTYAKSGQKPTNIPSNPCEVYASQWQGWHKWLGKKRLTADEQRMRTLELGRVHVSTRNARKNAVQGGYTSAQVGEQLIRQKYRCYYAACGFAKFKVNERRTFGYDFHVDHTFPLSRMSGSDIPANDMGYLVLACPSCNSKKSDKFPWEWPEGGRLL